MEIRDIFIFICIYVYFFLWYIHARVYELPGHSATDSTLHAGGSSPTNTSDSGIANTVEEKETK